MVHHQQEDQRTAGPVTPLSLRPFFVVAGTLALLFALAAVPYVGRFHLSAREIAGVYLAFLSAVLLVLVPAFEGTRQAASHWLSSSRLLAILPGLWCLPYLIYAAGTGDFRWPALLRLLALAALPLALHLLSPVRTPALFTWQDAVVAVLLIGAVLSHALSGIWNVPVHLDFMSRLFLLAVAAWTWTFVRPVPALGLQISLSPRILRAAAVNFALFAAIAIPAGLLMGFISWNPRWKGAPDFLLAYIEIFLFIALLEELFFRGFLQNLLSGRIGALTSQALISCLFGLFHILHAPFPNWRYVALATIAGWFYGSAFRATQNLTAPALLHAAVDTIWRTFLTRP